MYPIEIAGSIFEANGVSADLELPTRDRQLREWLVMRGVQGRWIDRMEGALQGELSLKVRDNYAFHIIQGQLILVNVTVVRQEQIVWSELNSKIDLTEFVMRDHVF